MRMLGGFELRGSGGRDLTPSGKKLRALVAVLALARGTGWSRERLMTLLWGDRDEEQARGSLRQALAELRRTLGEHAILADRETVVLDPGTLHVDAVEFAALSAAGSWEEAAALYGGDLLDGVSLPDAGFADWLVVERTRLHDMAVRALAHLLETQSGEAALTTAQRLLELDPTREDTHRALMRLYVLHGDRAQALRQYQLCRDLLWRGLSVKPEPETERLFQEIKSSTSAAPAAPRSSPILATPEPPPDSETPAPSPAIDRRPARAWRRWAVALALLAAIGGAGIAAAWHPWDGPAGARVAGAVADKPSVAVLPFENMS
ncbi:MAG TPA: BTAD domain-containing putative transcriptional regulator, partial [Dongiaceae bacterium]